VRSCLVKFHTLKAAIEFIVADTEPYLLFAQRREGGQQKNGIRRNGKTRSSFFHLLICKNIFMSCIEKRGAKNIKKQRI